MFITKQPAHGKPHTLREFQYLDSSGNPVLALISKPVGFNLYKFLKWFKALLPRIIISSLTT
jgi:hypothetical protein